MGLLGFKKRPGSKLALLSAMREAPKRALTRTQIRWHPDRGLLGFMTVGTKLLLRAAQFMVLCLSSLRRLKHPVSTSTRLAARGLVLSSLTFPKLNYFKCLLLSQILSRPSLTSSLCSPAFQRLAPAVSAVVPVLPGGM